MSLRPISTLRVSKHMIPAFELFPNCSIQNKPLLIYHSVFKKPISPAKVESHLASVGIVSPQWRYTMYNFDHFHTTSHEVLCITQGRARVCFGAKENKARVEIVVESGDAVVVPAGVAHSLQEDLDGDFQMVGSYPNGSTFDMCYGKPGEEDKVANVKSLEWFQYDPIYGGHGPATE
ncbi:RmlC-like cupin domain-containing protein [Thelonectria olida]|uniref:RmlC-like cupin domain-containing protein n=1 Tax=Thelonectria olida TaxID=1576542 RepID=A0A9P8VSG2_9HYPO|nr:RmlC-like cupin domain-containing protein [Thelonectria olida]